MKGTLERAPSGRSKCRACANAIPKGELRVGEIVPNSFGEGETSLWYHTVCAACSRPECARVALEASSEQVPERDRLERLIADGLAHERVQRLARVERSVSGRARCRECKEAIAQGDWRMALHVFEEWRFSPLGYVHAACAAPYFESSELGERIAALNPELSAQDRSEIAALVASKPAGAPRLAKTSGEPLEDEEAKKASS